MVILPHKTFDEVSNKQLILKGTCSSKNVVNVKFTNRCTQVNVFIYKYMYIVSSLVGSLVRNGVKKILR